MADDKYERDEMLRDALGIDDFLLELQGYYDMMDGYPKAQALAVENGQHALAMVADGWKAIMTETMKSRGELERLAAAIYDTGIHNGRWAEARDQLRPGNADAPRLEAPRNDRRHMG